MTTSAENDEPRRARWEHATDWPLTIAAVAFLLAYAWPILDPALGQGGTGLVLRGVGLLVWLLFAVDYVARFMLSRRRAAFVRHHLLDLAAVVLPVFRPLRLLRLVKVLEVVNRNAGSSLRGRVAMYVAGSTVLVVFVASLAELEAERDRPGATIATFGQSLWWAVTTVTTVGYGDLHPVTTQGRFVAAGLMLGGIALLGVVTASLASWLVQRVAQIEDEAQAATRRDLHLLTDEVAELRRLLEARLPSS